MFVIVIHEMSSHEGLAFILNLLHFFRTHYYNMYIEINIKLVVFGGLIELLAHLLLVGMNNAATW